MNRISTGILASTLFLVSACGTSSSGNSKGNAQCKTADNAAKLNSVVIPGSNTSSPANKTPAIPGTPANAGGDFPSPTADNCDTPVPGNLGNNPTTGTPIAGNPTTPPTFPGRNTPNVPVTNPPTTGGNTPTGGNRGAAFDVTPLLGSWNFQGVFCDNGSITPALQRINQMRMSDEFYVTLTITRSGMEEFRWVKLQDENTGSDMMCTLQQKATYTSNGPGYLRVTVAPATYQDAGGATTCNLGSEDAAVYEKVGFVMGGNDMMIRSIANAPECNGSTMLQSFEKRP